MSPIWPVHRLVVALVGAAALVALVTQVRSPSDSQLSAVSQASARIGRRGTTRVRNEIRDLTGAAWCIALASPYRERLI